MIKKCKYGSAERSQLPSTSPLRKELLNNQPSPVHDSENDAVNLRLLPHRPVDEFRD